MTEDTMILYLVNYADDSSSESSVDTTRFLRKIKYDSTTMHNKLDIGLMGHSVIQQVIDKSTSCAGQAAFTFITIRYCIM